jgi:hypothetical protein
MISYYDINTKILIISRCFNKELKNIPEETEIMIFSENYAKYKYSLFNQQIDNLPENITHLTFGYSFNQPVDNLPKKLTHLTFGKSFNQPVDNLLKTLTHLSFGSCFNQSLNKLPENLIFLKLGLNFQQDVILPKKIKEIALSYENKKINNLPEHIEKIFIYFDIDDYYNQKIDNLPITIKEIVIKKEEHKKFLLNIPFETIITVQPNYFY